MNLPVQRLNVHSWLTLPTLGLLGLIGLRFGLTPDTFDRLVMSEQGLVELATVGLLLPAVVLAVLILNRRRRLPGPGLTVWIAAMGAGCFYFAGEELSWGQHLVGWETPESIRALNDQAETNLHNMSSWLDQKPRLLLELWILIGGVGVATGRLIRGYCATRARDWIWPPAEVVPAAWLAIAVRIPERWSSWTGEVLPPFINIRLSEIQELYFAAVLLLYLAWARRQLIQPAAS